MANGIWIRKRKNNKAEVWVVYKDNLGKRHREKVGENSALMRQKAKIALAKRQSDIIDGKFSLERENKNWTLDEACEKYLVVWSSQLRSDFSKRQIAQIPKELKAMRLVDLTPERIQQAYNERLERASPSTANRWLSVLKSVINRAKDWGYFKGDNHAVKIKRRPNNPARIRYLSESEIASFVANCDSRLYPIVFCALLTGMRRGEILGMRWEDIDWNKSVIHLPKTKSGQPRWVPVSSKLMASLSALPREEDKVFPISLITFRRLFDKARKASQLPSFRFHDLRRTFATHYFSRTHDINNARIILGHSTLQMTQRYLGPDAEALRLGVDQMDGLLPGLAKPFPELVSADVAGVVPRLLEAPSPLISHHPRHQPLTNATDKT